MVYVWSKNGSPYDGPEHWIDTFLKDGWIKPAHAPEKREEYVWVNSGIPVWPDSLTVYGVSNLLRSGLIKPVVATKPWPITSPIPTEVGFGAPDPEPHTKPVFKGTRHKAINAQCLTLPDAACYMKGIV